MERSFRFEENHVQANKEKTDQHLRHHDHSCSRVDEEGDIYGEYVKMKLRNWWPPTLWGRTALIWMKSFVRRAGLKENNCTIGSCLAAVEGNLVCSGTIVIADYKRSGPVSKLQVLRQ